MKEYKRPECGRIRVRGTGVLFLDSPEQPEETPGVYETPKAPITKDSMLPDLGENLFED